MSTEIDTGHALINENSSQSYLEIVNQPINKFRFRYESEMHGTHGCEIIILFIHKKNNLMFFLTRFEWRNEIPWKEDCAECETL